MRAASGGGEQSVSRGGGGPQCSGVLNEGHGEVAERDKEREREREGEREVRRGDIAKEWQPPPP